MLLNFVKLGGLQLSGVEIWEFSWIKIFRVGIVLDGNFPGGSYPG